MLEEEDEDDKLTALASEKLLLSRKNIDVSMRFSDDITRCLFGTTRSFYFTNQIKGFTGESEESSFNLMRLNKNAKDDTYYNAMERLGPSMNQRKNKLGDIRSLTSSRRLKWGSDQYVPKVALGQTSGTDIGESIDLQRSHVIDFRALRKISSEGIGDCGSRRGVTWRVLLGYLPLELEKWEEVLAKERGLYRKLVSELFVDPRHSSSTTLRSNVDISKFSENRLNISSLMTESEKTVVSETNHPLSLDNNSEWAQFFENERMLDEIRKDVVRTHPDLAFFLETERNLGQRRYAAIERILFVWAKLNIGVKYVQGMNEIVGTLYFVLASDFNEEWACEAEADTYFLFNILMVEMRDVFIPALDDSDTGIQGRISCFKNLLSLHDPEVRCHLDDLGIHPSFFAVRWLTTLLSREFLLPDTIRLWDSMLASTHKDNFLRYVSVTMVMAIRDLLLAGDFSTCLRLLQCYPPTDVGTILESSRVLWIYESQITLACQSGITLNQAFNTITPPEKIIIAYGLKNGLCPERHKPARTSKSKSSSSLPPFSPNSNQKFRRRSFSFNDGQNRRSFVKPFIELFANKQNDEQE